MHLSLLTNYNKVLSTKFSTVIHRGVINRLWKTWCPVLPEHHVLILHYHLLAIIGTRLTTALLLAQLHISSFDMTITIVFDFDSITDLILV